MLDISFIRENVDIVKKAIQDKRIVNVNVDDIVQADDKRRRLITQVDELRRKRNEAAHNRNIEEGRKIKDELGGLEQQLINAEGVLESLMNYVPNIPLDEVPAGSEADYQILEEDPVSEKKDFKIRNHIEIGELLDIIDIHRAAKVSGSRFVYLKGKGALLELALVNYAMQVLTEEGFTAVIPPALIKAEITKGLGYWHGYINDTYTANENYYLVSNLDEDESGNKNVNSLYLIGTGEHALVPMHRDETLEVNELPKKYAAFSSCFRREAGTYGKDSKGILRVHQFDKVEMVVFVKPENSIEEFKKMVEIAKELVESLKLPYRIIRLARGDLSLPSAETIDIETWIPSQNKYRETHSISTTTDFQARRLNIKVGDKLGSGFILGKSKLGNEYVHILNGTAFAIGRMIIAILENYQQKDGSVKIPEVLQKYTGFTQISPQK